MVMNPTGYDGIMRLNWLHPPFDNVKARQAMLYLIDQKAILNATFGDPKYYHPSPSIFGYDTPMSNDADTDLVQAGARPGEGEAAVPGIRLQGREGRWCCRRPTSPS